MTRLLIGTFTVVALAALIIIGVNRYQSSSAPDPIEMATTIEEDTTATPPMEEKEALLVEEEEDLFDESPTEIGISAAVMSAPSSTPPVEIAGPPVPEQATEMVATVPASSPSGFTGKAMMGHSAGLTKDNRGFSEFLVEVGYRINETHAVGVGQSARKLYEIAQTGEDEFIMNDTVLFHDWQVDKDWIMKSSATLPVSKESSDNDRITRLGVCLETTRQLGERFSITAAPKLAYTFNEYTTKSGGDPLERAYVGATVTLACVIVPKLTFGIWGNGGISFKEEYQDSNDTPAPVSSGQYGSFLGYQVNRNVGLSLGYAWSSSMLDGARYAPSFYDDDSDRVYANLVVTLD